MSRRYLGERDAERLIRWLNRHGKALNGRPVVRLWETYNEIREFLLKHKGAFVASYGQKLGFRSDVYPDVDPRSVRAFDKELGKQWLKTRRKLIAAYRQCNVRAGNVDFVRELTRRTRPDLYPPDDLQTLEEPRSRSQAAFDLVVLTYLPAFDRIRRCLTCGAFFYGRFKQKKFCSVRCQQVYYKRSPEWKAHRAEWMREYRRIKSTTNVK